MQAFLASVVVSLLFLLRCFMPAFIIYGISQICRNMGWIKEPACPPGGPVDEAEIPVSDK